MTGVFVSEALHPLKVFRKAGFEVDIVSETGTYKPDWLSLTEDWLPEEDRKIWTDCSSEFRSEMDYLVTPSDITLGDYKFLCLGDGVNVFEYYTTMLRVAYNLLHWCTLGR